MATYVALLKLTERGVKNIKDSCKRAADFKTKARKLGLEVKEQFWCLGAYDGVLVFDAPTTIRPRPRCCRWVSRTTSARKRSAASPPRT